MVFCNNVQYNKKYDLLVQCNRKMVQCERIVVNDAIIVTCFFISKECCSISVKADWVFGL